MKRRLAMGVAGSALAISLVATLMSPGSGKGARPGLLAAPRLAGRTVSGQPVSLSSARGRWVVVNFFASWCADCRSELPQLQRLSVMPGNRLDVISVDVHEPLTVGARFVQHNGGNWYVISDDAALGPFRIVGLPETVLVDPQGRIATNVLGPLTSKAEQAIAVECTRS